MIGTITTDRAKVTLMAVKAMSGVHDRQYANELKAYYKGIKVARQLNDQNLVKAYQKEIKRKREYLRQPHPQTYIFSVELKKYKGKYEIIMAWDRTRPRKEFRTFVCKEVVDEAIRQARVKVKLISQAHRVGLVIGQCFISKTHGKVYAEEGVFLKAHVKKNMKA